MRENIFRVWCEFEFDGEIVKTMESPASWFLLTQTGKLMTYGPGEPLQPLDKAYKKAIPLFYTGLKDRDKKEIYYDDIVRDEGDSIQPVKVVDKWTVIWWEIDIDKMNSPMSQVKIIGNKYENPELLEDKK
ncbi:unnamed protein product [marine sediment metagenome]|uniref:YopX protein domain-containing protein n=1 Tax=marine sediment metagenome TaxID=412755 RepID=X0WEA6_9ZZZZ